MHDTLIRVSWHRNLPAHLVVLGVGELQRQLGGLDVEGADAGLRPPDHVLPPLQADAPRLQHQGSGRVWK